MNLYAHLNRLKTSIGISVTDHDEELLRILEAVSREADDICLRHFYSVEATRYFTPQGADLCLTDDILAVSALAGDTANNETHTQSWTAGSDFLLGPANSWPKTSVRRAKGTGKYFQNIERFVKITGTFGYGTGRDGEPWRATSLTGTLDSASDSSLTLSASGGVYAGMTLKLDSEQVYVESVSGTTATVVRGVNGTTAAAHASSAVKVAQFPPVLEAAVIGFSVAQYNLGGKQGIKDIMIGEYRETLVWDDRMRDQFSTALGRLKRPGICVV